MDALIAIFSSPIFWLKEFLKLNLTDDRKEALKELIKLFETNIYKTEIDNSEHTIRFYLKCDKIPDTLCNYLTCELGKRPNVDIAPINISCLWFECAMTLFDTVSSTSYFTKNLDNGFNGILIDIDIE